MKKKSFVQSLIFRFADNTYMTSEHVGTHMDAPYHMWEAGWKVGTWSVTILNKNRMSDINFHIHNSRKFYHSVSTLNLQL